ncbi:hypothetical protein F7725_025038, partial [Dissostichus mawsoni]
VKAVQGEVGGDGQEKKNKDGCVTRETSPSRTVSTRGFNHRQVQWVLCGQSVGTGAGRVDEEPSWATAVVMSSLEERDGVAAPGSSSAGMGVGAVGAAVEAVAGVAAMQEEVGIRREGPEPDPDEPPKKRVRVPDGESGKLEERLYSVLCCTVCIDLPKASVYQCSNGHLMCAGCFIHLLADSRLKEEQATCPNCRCEISKNLCCRNLAVEKAVSELPTECAYCTKQFPRSSLEDTRKRIAKTGAVQAVPHGRLHHPLYYETPRFTVLNQTWVLKARVNDSERNPNLSCKRTLSFQLILKSKVNSALECSFLLLKGPYDDVRIKPVIHHHSFCNDANETEYVPLPISDSVECNKLLAAKNINLRLFIFQELSDHGSVRRGFISTERPRPGHRGGGSWEGGSCPGGGVGAPRSSNPPPWQLYFGHRTLQRLPAEKEKDIKNKKCRRFVPEVRAGSSWVGLEGEEGGEALHRCNPGWEGRGAGLHPSTDSSHEQTARRGLQSVGQKKDGKNTHKDARKHTCILKTRSSDCVLIHTVVYGCEAVTGNICGAVYETDEY